MIGEGFIFNLVEIGSTVVVAILGFRLLLKFIKYTDNQKGNQTYSKIRE